MISLISLRGVLACTVALGAAALLSGTAYAANWHDPYGNVDHRVDAGNDTGDSQVDQLNAQQLNENYRGPYYIGRPPPPGVRPPAYVPNGYSPPAPPGYYPPASAGYPPPPPPGYVPPPPPGY